MSLNLHGDCNDNTRVKGGYFYGAISNFRFIVSLVMAKNLLEMCLPATRALQSSSIDILTAIETITSLKTLSQSLRSNVDKIHSEWYSQALHLANAVNVEEWKPRNCSFQKNRDNVPFSSISDYYKKCITIPILDNFLNDIKNRFNNQAIASYHGLSIIPASIVSNKPLKSNLSWREQFLKFVNMYRDDLPNPEVLNGELDVWENDWLNSVVKAPESLSLTLKLTNFEGYSNIKEALKILATLPVTSCECERSFSSLKLLKSFNRSTMVTDRLNGLALVYIHQDKEPNVERILKKFSLMKDRRFKF